MSLLAIHDLHIDFALPDGREQAALKGVSFAVPKGTITALVGESGSGKSVSALAIMGLLPNTARIASQSRILFDGVDLLREAKSRLRARCGHEIGMIFQEPMSSLNPVYTVGSQIAEVLRLHRNLGRRAAWQRAVELLAEVGIPEPAVRAQFYPHQLSGGQQQRVMIAMAMACEPKLLIADEPTTALDVTVQRQIIELLRDLQQRHGMAILFITHDLGLVSELADHIVVMQHGEIREQGRTIDVLLHPQHAYTRALLACRPRLNRRPMHLPVVSDFLDGEPTLSPERERGVSLNDEIVLEARGISTTFTRRIGLWQKHETHAVRDVSFKLARGKTLGIVGESGSGKTTLGKTVLRLTPASAGEVWFEGRDLLRLDAGEFHAMKRRLQIVFQNPYASLNPRWRIGQILLEPMQIHGIGADSHEREARMVTLLQRVGLQADDLRRYPHEFSGGQRQRIGIARCLTLQPEIIVCDESVSALDVSVQAQVLNVLTELQDDLGLSYLFISHDLAVVKHMADEVLVMQAGQVVETGDVEALFHHPQHPYTQTLLAAIPRR